MFNRTNCDRKSQLSGIFTKPLNPRELWALGLNKRHFSCTFYLCCEMQTLNLNIFSV